jgi:hypothetical protein
MNIEELPKIGSTYRHNNGNTYKVILIANIDSNNEQYPITIIYEGYSNHKIWAKTLDNFLLKMSLINDNSPT